MGRIKVNKFDEKHIFRMATNEDVDAIMKFIKEFWNENHILAKDKDFFLYEFSVENRINFNLAINRETEEIDVIFGFFQYGEHFVSGQTDASGALSKVRPGCKIPFIGIEVIRRFIDETAPRIYVGIGANPNTSLKLTKGILKHYTGRLQHFYILSDREEYKIAYIKNKKSITITENEQLEMRECETIEELYECYNEQKYNDRPYKERWYINKRYFNHPIYKYRVFIVDRELVVIGREVCINSAKIFRIVDVLGNYDYFKYIGNALYEMIQKEDYEYIDIYEKGIPDEAIKAAGFVERMEEDENIIPNYFEPFLQKNIEIYYHVKDADICIFKADGDQDRPSYR